MIVGRHTPNATTVPVMNPRLDPPPKTPWGSPFSRHQTPAPEPCERQRTLQRCTRPRRLDHIGAAHFAVDMRRRSEGYPNFGKRDADEERGARRDAEALLRRRRYHGPHCANPLKAGPTGQRERLNYGRPDSLTESESRG